MKAGILYPHSKAHPGLTAEYLAGLKSSLKQQQLDNDITIVSESIGLGGSEKEVYEKAEKLLVWEDVDLIIAYIDLRVLPLLEPLLYSSGKLVLVVNPGANYPNNWVPQPNILFLTLQHAFLCSLTGALPVINENEKAVVATTFYDCGYLHSAAMVKGYLQKGGKIGFNYVNNQRYDANFNTKELVDHLTAEDKTENLLCIFDEMPASLFYECLNASDVAARSHLFVSPMMLQPKALEKMADGFKFSIQGYLPWHASSENEANNLFVNSLRSQQKEPGIFSLLGWETALILGQITQHCKDHQADGAKIAEILASTKIESPRGELKLDPHTNYFISPVIKCSINNNTNKIELEQMEIPLQAWTAFTEMPCEGVSSGWTNTYLCY